MTTPALRCKNSEAPGWSALHYFSQKTFRLQLLKLRAILNTSTGTQIPLDEDESLPESHFFLRQALEGWPKNADAAQPKSLSV